MGKVGKQVCQLRMSRGDHVLQLSRYVYIDTSCDYTNGLGQGQGKAEGEEELGTKHQVGRSFTTKVTFLIHLFDSCLSLCLPLVVLCSGRQREKRAGTPDQEKTEKADIVLQRGQQQRETCCGIKVRAEKVFIVLSCSPCLKAKL